MQPHFKARFSPDGNKPKRMDRLRSIRPSPEAFGQAADDAAVVPPPEDTVSQELRMERVLLNFCGLGRDLAGRRNGARWVGDNKRFFINPIGKLVWTPDAKAQQIADLQ